MVDIIVTYSQNAFLLSTISAINRVEYVYSIVIIKRTTYIFHEHDVKLILLPKRWLLDLLMTRCVRLL